MMKVGDEVEIVNTQYTSPNLLVGCIGVIVGLYSHGVDFKPSSEPFNDGESEGWFFDFQELKALFLFQLFL